MPTHDHAIAEAAAPDPSNGGGRTPRRVGGAVRVAQVIAVALLGAALIYSGWIAKREWAAEQIEAAANRVAVGGATDQASADLDRWLALCGADCPARGAEAAAAAKAALAARAQGARRAELYDEALALTHAALKRNPISAEGWARLAMILSEMRGGALTPEIARALRTSYSAAPFSRGAAVWRIGFCGSHWSDLAPDLRRHAVDELTWLSRIDPSLVREVIDRTGDPAAKFTFELAVSIPGS
jgi:hypothetical protein